MPLVFTILSSSLQNASTLPRKCQCTQNDKWRIIASSSPPAKRRLRRPPDEQKVGVPSQLPTAMYVPSWRARRVFFFSHLHAVVSCKDACLRREVRQWWFFCPAWPQLHRCWSKRGEEATQKVLPRSRAHTREEAHNASPTFSRCGHSRRRRPGRACCLLFPFATDSQQMQRRAVCTGKALGRCVHLVRQTGSMFGLSAFHKTHPINTTRRPVELGIIVCRHRM